MASTVLSTAAPAPAPAAAPACNDAAAANSTSWGTRIVNALSAIKDFVASVAQKIYDLVMPYVNHIVEIFTKHQRIAVPAAVVGGAAVALLWALSKYLCGQQTARA